MSIRSAVQLKYDVERCYSNGNFWRFMKLLLPFIILDSRMWRSKGHVVQTYHSCSHGKRTTRGDHNLGGIYIYFDILSTAKAFLGHRSRRLQWPIVITRCPASVVCRLSVRQFTFSTSSPEPRDGFWWNLVWMKYSRSLTSVVVFRPDPPRGDPGQGKNRSRGVPFFKELLLQTGRLQEQTECIAVI